MNHKTPKNKKLRWTKKKKNTSMNHKLEALENIYVDELHTTYELNKWSKMIMMQSCKIGDAQNLEDNGNHHFELSNKTSIYHLTFN